MLAVFLNPRVHCQTLDAFSPSLDSSCGSIAEQADGKLVLGGSFTNVAGSTRKYLARVHPDGTLDTAFNAAINNRVDCLAIEPEGKILAGGRFSQAGGQPRHHLARFYPNGALDPSFQPTIKTNVLSLALQPDGKILVGGGTYGPVGAFLIRLNPDGTPDGGFNFAAEQTVRAIRLQPDGKILVVGFQSITRLNTDGTLDGGFHAEMDSIISALAVQPDGKILVGGSFKNVSGSACNYFGRLNDDGSLDNSFAPAANSAVRSMVLETDGKVVVGGEFWNLNGQPRIYFGRVLPDGAVDSGFVADCDRIVWGAAAQSNGQILLAGDFSSVLGQPRRELARLNQPEPFTQSLLVDGTTIRWLRSGAGPEVWAATFDASTNGHTWTHLGAGNRVAGGFLLSAADLPANATLRAHGYTIAGSSGWLVESSIGPPAFFSQSGPASIAFGTTTNFQVLVAGSAPISFQWYKSGSPVGDAGGISGTTSTTLVLSNAFGLHSGDYSVVASNALGSATGMVAVLRVADPAITTVPSSQTVDAGRPVILNVSVRGSPPFGFQWCKDGFPLVNGDFVSGATSGILTLTKVFGGDSGDYTMIATNAWGCTTGLVTTLNVIDPVITRQPSNMQTNAGSTALLSVVAVGTDLLYQWRKQGSEIPGATASVLALTNVQRTDAGPYDVVITSAYGSLTSAVATLTPNLAALGSFNPGADAAVYALALQRDANLLVGGRFTKLCGVAKTWLGRIKPDGTLDAAFNPNPNNWVNCLAVQNDGRILVGGGFTTLFGEERLRIGRLETDGSLDATFAPGASGVINALLVQPDGRILVGGTFNTLAGRNCSCLGRLEPDGTLDATFDAGTNGAIFSIGLQGDGKVLVAGPFNTLAGQSRKFLGRLNPDGTLDSTFTPTVDQQVTCTVVQPNGQILIGGDFKNVNGLPRSSIARLNPDGSLEQGFNAGTNSPVTSLLLQVDGRILVATVSGFVRLNPDGSVDDWFNMKVSGRVLCLAGDSSGRIFLGGEFTSIAGQTRTRVAEVANLEANPEDLSFDGATLTWRRHGAALEVRSAGFDVSTNAIDWVRINDGNRVADGWQVTGLDYPTNSYFRARGSISGGMYNGSEWFLENLSGPLFIHTHPISQTVLAGQNVLLSVSISGLEPVVYQWRKDGKPLEGATGSSLSLKGVQWTNIGDYDAVVMNSAAAMTSAIARLTVSVPAVLDSWKPAVNGSVNPIIVQSDGKVVFGYKSIVRLNASGAVDPDFTPPELNREDYNSYVNCLAVQQDGKILAGGSFTNRLLPSRTYLERLHPDGSLDLSFNPAPDNRVDSLAIQADGKILVGGYFTNLAGQFQNHLARLNPDGTLDATFAPGVEGYINSFALQTDGKILVGGYFTSLCGQRRISLGRLNSDGSLDQSFAPEAPGRVYCVAVQRDGKILVSGQFTQMCKQPRANIGRLKPDGSLDLTFNPGANGDVGALAIQADGKILVSGWFTSIGGQTRNYLARLEADGSVDPTFNPSPNRSVYAVLTMPDGKALFSGYFTSVGGASATGLARLNATYPAVESLAFDGSTISWLRSGTGPELSYAKFECWEPGSGWTNVDSAQPISGGWQVTGLNLPLDSGIRARGYVISDDSGWFVESIRGGTPQPPLRILVSDPFFGFSSNQFGFNVSAPMGQVVVLESSTNLIDWSALATNTIGTQHPDFSDPSVVNAPSKYYRVRAHPSRTGTE